MDQNLTELRISSHIRRFIITHSIAQHNQQCYSYELMLGVAIVFSCIQQIQWACSLLTTAFSGKWPMYIELASRYMWMRRNTKSDYNTIEFSRTICTQHVCNSLIVLWWNSKEQYLQIARTTGSWQRVL